MAPATDTGPRTTATSVAEGRMKVDVGAMKRSKKSKLKKMIHDGKGGLSNVSPLNPPLGVQLTQKSYAPGQTSTGVGPMSNVKNPQTPPTPGLDVASISNKPHKSMSRFSSSKSGKISGFKAPKMKKLKSLVAPKLKKIPSVI